MSALIQCNLPNSYGISHLLPWCSPGTKYAFEFKTLSAYSCTRGDCHCRGRHPLLRRLGYVCRFSLHPAHCHQCCIATSLLSSSGLLRQRGGHKKMMAPVNPVMPAKLLLLLATLPLQSVREFFCFPPSWEYWWVGPVFFHDGAAAHFVANSALRDHDVNSLPTDSYCFFSWLSPRKMQYRVPKYTKLKGNIFRCVISEIWNISSFEYRWRDTLNGHSLEMRYHKINVKKCLAEVSAHTVPWNRYRMTA